MSIFSRNVVGLKEKLYICIDNFKRRTIFL